MGKQNIPFSSGISLTQWKFSPESPHSQSNGLNKMDPVVTEYEPGIYLCISVYIHSHKQIWKLEEKLVQFVSFHRKIHIHMFSYLF